jgi:hypothetical protein
MQRMMGDSAPLHRYIRFTPRSTNGLLCVSASLS